MVPMADGMFMSYSWCDYANDIAINYAEESILDVTPDGTIHVEFEQEDCSSMQLPSVDDDEFMRVLEECG